MIDKNILLELGYTEDDKYELNNIDVFVKSEKLVKLVVFIPHDLNSGYIEVTGTVLAKKSGRSFRIETDLLNKIETKEDLFEIESILRIMAVSIEHE